MDWKLAPCSALCVSALCSSPTDESCICPDRRSGAPPWRRDLLECISANCTSLEYYETAGITYHNCGIPNTVEGSMATLIAVTSVVQLIFFTARMISIRLKRERNWAWEDITFITSSVLLVLTLPVLILESHYGFLSNIWDLRITRIDDFTKVFFCYSILYSLSLAMIKISIVFLYLRIFRAQGVLVNYIIMGTQVFNVIIFLIFFVGLFIACQPLVYYWSYAAPATGSCPDPIDRGLVYPLLNIIMDAWLLILPMSQIWSMGLSWRSKMGVLAMFGLGLVTGTMTILRVLVYRENIDDWILQLDLSSGLQWSVIEVTTAYVISCMPATRFLFVQLLPKVQRLPAVQRARPYLAWVSWPESWTRRSKSSNGLSGISDATTAHVVARQEDQLELGHLNLKDATTETSDNMYGSMDCSTGSAESQKHGWT